jgi:hypothetical protein
MIVADSRGRLARVAGMVLLALSLLVAGNAVYRNKTTGLWQHPDQLIPLRVLQAMHAGDSLDTDWAKTSMPEHFREFRYNFSGYLLLARLATVPMGDAAYASDTSLSEALLRVSRVASALTLVLVFWILARTCGPLVGLAGAIAAMAIPQLLQDANYVRPEAVSTLLFTLGFGLACLRPRHRCGLWMLMLGLSGLAGFLASIKFTYAVAGLLVVPSALRLMADPDPMHGRGARTRMIALPIVILGAGLAGFAAGAPGAIADPAGYLQGLQALRHQYGSGHPPHGRMQPGVLAQAAHIGHYYLAVLGVPMLLLHLAGYAGRALSPAKFVYGAIALLTIAGFLAQNVFFERNFSILLPAFVIVSALGAHNAMLVLTRRLPAFRGRRAALQAAAALLVVASALPAAGTTARLAPLFRREGITAFREHVEAREADARARSGAATVLRIPYGDVHALRYPDAATCTLFVADTYADDWSRRYFEQLPMRFVEVAQLPSLFAGIPTSTLHTYHSAHTVMFVDRNQCPRSGARRAAGSNTMVRTG